MAKRTPIQPAGVLMLTCEYAPFPGGIATYASELVGEVKRAGYRAEVVAPDYPDMPSPADPTVHRVLSHHAFTPAQAMAAIGALRRAPPDLILLAADIRAVLLAYVNRLLGGRPYRAAIHGSEVSKFGPGAVLRPLVRRAYLGADMVSSNSAATLDIFVRTLGRPSRGVVNHLGVDEHCFAQINGPFDHSALAALAQDTAVVCTVGRLEQRKGQSEAIEVMRRVREQTGIANLAYVVAGRPEDLDYDRQIRAQAETLDLPVIFTGPLTDADVVRLFRRSACHLLCAQPLPGKVEGFGLVLLEAAAQGCPSVTTRVGGIPEAMGTSGVVCESTDLAGIAAAVAGYLTDRAARRQASEAALAHARKFTWKSCASGTFPELSM